MLRYEQDGADLYPALRQFAAEHREPAWERVRFELLRRFGYFVTESSEHFSEYVPWFIKPGRDDLIQKLQHPARRVSGALRGPNRRLGRLPLTP